MSGGCNTRNFSTSRELSGQVSAIVQSANLDVLVKDWNMVRPYWDQYLLEYPEHPVSAGNKRNCSIACTLYRDMATTSFKTCAPKPPAPVNSDPRHIGVKL